VGAKLCFRPPPRRFNIPGKDTRRTCRFDAYEVTADWGWGGGGGGEGVEFPGTILASI